MSGKKIMKKALKIFLYVLAALILLLLLVIYWQRENIKLVADLMSSSGAEIMEKVEQSNKDIEEALGKYGLTVEDVGLNKKDEPTPSHGEDEKTPLVSEAPEKTPLPEEKPVSPKPEGAKVDVSGEIVKRYASDMQALRASYEAQLEALWSQAEGDFRASVPKEKRSPATRAPFISKYVGRAYSLQSRCDADVNKLLANLERELSDVGADTSIVETMRTAYKSEKSAKMAQFMGRMD